MVFTGLLNCSCTVYRIWDCWETCKDPIANFFEPPSIKFFNYWPLDLPVGLKQCECLLLIFSINAVYPTMSVNIIAASWREELNGELRFLYSGVNYEFSVISVYYLLSLRFNSFNSATGGTAWMLITENWCIKMTELLAIHRLLQHALSSPACSRFGRARPWSVLDIHLFPFS